MSKRSPAWGTTTRILVIAVSLVLIGFLIYESQPLFGPLIVAGLLAYTLNLLVRFINGKSALNRKWSVSIVYFLFVGLLIAAPGTLVPVTVRQARAMSQQLVGIAEQVETFLAVPLVVFGQTIPFDQLLGDLTDMTTSFAPAFGGAIAVVETTSVNLVRLLIIIVVSYYLLMDWQGLKQWLLGILTEDGKADADRLLKEVDRVWRAYMQGTLALMLIMGILFIIIGLAIGLPGAVAIGILTGFLSMIPEIGPWISGIVAVSIAFFAGSNHLPISNVWFAVVVAAIYVIVTQIKAIWLRPQVMGRFMHMNTGLVFLAVIAAVMLQGILAALVVLPILASLGVLGRYTRAKLLNLDPWPLEELENPPLAQDQPPMEAAPETPPEEMESGPLEDSASERYRSA
jgi:predicted PurR-regulated permease PerM